MPAFTLAALAGQTPVRPIPRVLPNDNRTPAGVLAKGVLTLHLEARLGRWFPDVTGPSLVMPMFAGAGKPPRNSGPMIRVTAGTTIRVSVRNTLDSTLVVYGLMSRPGALRDTIQVRPGGIRELAFTAGAPGTYFYWGTITHYALADRGDMESHCRGGIFIDTRSLIRTLRRSRLLRASAAQAVYPVGTNRRALSFKARLRTTRRTEGMGLPWIGGF